MITVNPVMKFLGFIQFQSKVLKQKQPFKKKHQISRQLVKILDS